MANPDFSISDVLEWARTKPADKRYSYSGAGDCNGYCALDYFFIETGLSSDPHVLPASWFDNQGNEQELPEWADLAVVASPETFGALVTRLEALLPPISSTWTSADAYADAYLIGVVA